jgi:hypothetical protein
MTKKVANSISGNHRPKRPLNAGEVKEELYTQAPLARDLRETGRADLIPVRQRRHRRRVKGLLRQLYK